MSLSRRRLRTLRRIERDLAASEPGLHAFFLSFNSRAANSRAGENDMPRMERIAPWPSRMLARLRGARSGAGVRHIIPVRERPITFNG